MRCISCKSKKPMIAVKVLVSTLGIKPRIQRSSATFRVCQQCGAASQPKAMRLVAKRLNDSLLKTVRLVGRLKHVNDANTPTVSIDVQVPSQTDR